MMRRRFAWLAACVVWSGCSGDNEHQARYQLERRYYEARLLERDAYDTYPFDDFAAWRVAMAAYNGVLLSNPARIPESRTWDARLVTGMERVALAGEIGLARLEAVDYRFHDGVSHRPPPPQLPRAFGGIELDALAPLYDSLGVDPQGDACERRIRAIVSNPLLWQDTALLRDSLLAIPALLAARHSGLTAQADAFYGRIIAAWPDSTAAARAHDYRAQVRIGNGDPAAALSDLDSALARHPDTRRRAELALQRCDVLAFDLGRAAEASAALRAMVDADPAGEWAWRARVRLAVIDPPPAGSAERLREIHLDERAPGDVAAAAMFARASDHAARGERDEAHALFWRITQRHPDSIPAMAAPIVVLRAALSRGDAEAARSALETALDFYQRAIRRDSESLSPRFLAMDCLLEASVAAGQPERGIEALLRASEGLRRDSRGVAGYKAAAAAAFSLRDIEKSVEILEKDLELVRGSRYSRCVRWKLQRTREARDG